MKRDNKTNIGKVCAIVVGCVLVLSVAFVFLVFRTDYIYNVDADSTFASANFERTSVTTVIEEIERLKGGDGSLVPSEEPPEEPELPGIGEDVDSDWWYTPDTGTMLEVNHGVDTEPYQLAVGSKDTWSIEFSIPTAQKKSTTVYNRVMAAISMGENNADDPGDILKVTVDGYKCFGGAMVNPPFNAGDIVLVELDDGTQFYFILYDTKYTGHTSGELASNQVQHAYGHGYDNGDSVQLSICEFQCTQSRGNQTNAKFLPSGGFLADRKVKRCKVVHHVDL